MKVLLIVCVIFAELNVILAQNNILEYDPKKRDFTNKEPIPFGEPIIVKGYTSKTTSILTIKTIFGLNETTVVGNLSSEQWSAIVGPFPKRTNVIFEIIEGRKISGEEMDKIIQYWQNQIASAIQESLDSEASFKTTDEYFNTIFNPIKVNFIEEWAGITLSSGVSLSDYVISIMESKIKEDWDNWNIMTSNLRELQNVKKSDFYKLYLVNFKEQGNLIKVIMDEDDPVRKLFSMDEESVDNLIQEILNLNDDGQNSKASLKEMFKRDISDNKKKYQQGLNSLRNEVNKLTFLKSEVIQITHLTSAETLGLESWLGVDLGTVYTHKTSTTHFFITLNPYLKKTDPERDYSLFEHNLLHNLTPSIGFGIGSGVENIKPVYFVGIGLRLNSAVRVGFGGTYFLSGEDPKYEWNPSFYGSISMNFISELFRLVNAASSNITN